MKATAILSSVVIGALMICGVVGIAISHRREPVARAEAPSDSETRFLETRSGRVHLLDLGEVRGISKFKGCSSRSRF